jgi:hypothetical protein
MHGDTLWSTMMDARAKMARPSESLVVRVVFPEELDNRLPIKIYVCQGNNERYTQHNN